MARRGVLRTMEGGLVSFWCPGCQEAHSVRTESMDGKPVWGFNGDYDRPTFTPSVLMTSGHYVSFHKPGDLCWCSYDAEHPDRTAPFKCTVCHSFVTDGKIQFLGDCTHALAGQTVALGPFGEA